MQARNANPYETWFSHIYWFSHILGLVYALIVETIIPKFVVIFFYFYTSNIHRYVLDFGEN